MRQVSRYETGVFMAKVENGLILNSENDESLTQKITLLSKDDPRHFAERNPAVLYLNSIKSKDRRIQHGHKLARFARCWSQLFHPDPFLVSYKEPVGTTLQITPWRDLTAFAVNQVMLELTEGSRILLPDEPLPVDATEAEKASLRDRLRANQTDARQASASTHNQYLGAIKNVAKFAAMAEVIAPSEAALIKAIPLRNLPEKSTSQCVTPQDARTLIDHCMNEQTVRGHRDAVLFLLYFTTGARRNEIVSLEVKDFNRLERTIKIIGKGDRVRTSRVHPEAYSELCAWLDENEIRQGKIFRRISKSDRVIHERDCNPARRTHRTPNLTGVGIYTILKRRVAEAGLNTKYHPHAFRHGAITNLAKRGVDIGVITYQMGQKDPKTAMRYMHHLEEAAADAIDNLKF